MRRQLEGKGKSPWWRVRADFCDLGTQCGSGCGLFACPGSVFYPAAVWYQKHRKEELLQKKGQIPRQALELFDSQRIVATNCYHSLRVERP
ncbi:hypothetical protein NDU88_006411 [Pleurodeles waltl]|uniref:Uncharacterized protein n=1 Tax=Pleurodeles waltl TaxID=8319 RepID=A0AAV7NQN8_PLEWA|nr:hypothetical protein NDU88_006411 [Pleurodeles waltl]